MINQNLDAWLRHMKRLVQANGLGRMALDRLFGEGRWNFVTLANRSDSVEDGEAEVRA